MAKPKIVLHMGGGLIQDITTDCEMKVLVIDSDVEEEPNKDNDVLNIEGDQRVVFLYPPNVLPFEVNALFERVRRAVLLKEGWLDEDEMKGGT